MVLGNTKMVAPAVLVALALTVWCVGCGSGYEQTAGDDPTAEGEIIGALAGVIDYNGSATGTRLVVGLIDVWPMTGPPVRFWEVPGFDGTFPVTYQFDLDEYLEGKPYYLAAFLDVDTTDINLMMNSEVDPMDLPDEGEAPVEIEAGVMVRDFVLDDPEDVDFWWVAGDQ